MALSKVKGPTHRQMAVPIAASGKTTKRVAQESAFVQMETSTMVTGKKTKGVAKVN